MTSCRGPAAITRPASRWTTESTEGSDDSRWEITKAVLPRMKGPESAPDQLLRPAVHRRGRLVEDQQRRLLQEDARQGHPLALARRELISHPPHHRFVTHREPADHSSAKAERAAAVTSSSLACGSPKRMFLRMVALNRKVSAETRPTWRRRTSSGYSDSSRPARRMRPASRLVEAQQEIDQGALAGAAGSHYPDDGAAGKVERDVEQHRLVGAVGEADAVEADGRARRQRAGGARKAGRVVLPRLTEQLQHPVEGAQGALPTKGTAWRDPGSDRRGRRAPR